MWCAGVRYQELNIGSGPAASSGDVVLFDYVLRRSNGYFIYGAAPCAAGQWQGDWLDERRASGMAGGAGCCGGWRS